MNCARNYENMLNFVKVMPKILLVPFFPDTVYIKLILRETGVIASDSMRLSSFRFSWWARKDACFVQWST